jgi:hypothetical protein
MAGETSDDSFRVALNRRVKSMSGVTLSILAVNLVLAGASYAQKAQPVRIRFADGAASTTVEGRLRGRQQMEYEAAARASQTLTLRLSAAPAGTFSLKLYNPEGAEMPLRKSGANRWSAELPQTGDYGISVLRTSPSRGDSPYKLVVTIR